MQFPKVMMSTKYVCINGKWNWYCLLMTAGKSFMYKRNSVGPNAEPCGTPFETAVLWFYYLLELAGICLGCMIEKVKQLKIHTHTHTHIYIYITCFIFNIHWMEPGSLKHIRKSASNNARILHSPIRISRACR